MIKDRFVEERVLYQDVFCDLCQKKIAEITDLWGYSNKDYDDSLIDVPNFEKATIKYTIDGYDDDDIYTTHICNNCFRTVVYPTLKGIGIKLKNQLGGEL